MIGSRCGGQDGGDTLPQQKHNLRVRLRRHPTIGPDASHLCADATQRIFLAGFVYQFDRPEFPADINWN